jgi:hypothetical protein
MRWTSSQPFLRKCQKEEFPDNSYALIRNTSTTSTSCSGRRHPHENNSQKSRPKNDLPAATVSAGRVRGRLGAEQLAASARARQNELLDFVFAYLDQLTNIPARLRNISGRYRFCRTAGEFVEAVECRAQLRKGFIARCARSGNSRLSAVPNSPFTKRSSSSRRIRLSPPSPP